MRSEVPDHDPRDIWQNQPTEAFKVSASQLRRKAQERQSTARFEARLSMLLGFTLGIFFGWGCVKAHGLFPRMGLGLLSLWSLYYAYQAYKWIWPGRAEPETALSTTLESYRSYLEKRRDFTRHIWRRAGLPFCFLGLGLIVVPELIKSLGAPRLALNVLPVCVILAIWLAIFFPQRKRRQKKLEQEIEELLAFEREKQA